MSHDDGKTTIHATMNKERNDVKMYRDFSALLALLLLVFAPFLKLLCLHMRTVSTSSSMYVQATNELNASVVNAWARDAAAGIVGGCWMADMMRVVMSGFWLLAFGFELSRSESSKSYMYKRLTRLHI